MLISKVIKNLQKIQREEGNLEVVMCTGKGDLGWSLRVFSLKEFYLFRKGKKKMVELIF